MSTKFIQDGKVLDYTATAAITANDVITIGPLVGVALSDAAIGDEISVAISGVWSCPKVGATAMAQGDVVDWDASVSQFVPAVTPAAGDVSDGCIVAIAAASADTHVSVLLNAGQGTLT